MAFAISSMFAFVALATRASASTFLEAHPSSQGEFMSSEEVEFALLEVLDQEELYIDPELSVLFRTMPKNEHGRLEHSVVRYIMHRFFALKYGWHVRGLEPSGAVFNTSVASSEIVKNRVPGYIQDLFEQHSDGHGMSLEELAIFAQTVSELVQREAALDLEEIVGGHELTGSSADAVLKAYLGMYIKGFHFRRNSTMNIKAVEEELEAFCIAWDSAKVWMKDIRHTVDYLLESRRNPFKSIPGKEIIVNVVQEVGYLFGSFQNLECKALKEHLVEMEDEGTGRVLLSNFYSGIDDKDWPFIESTEYLRSLGALDESDPGRVRVVIPNYLGSRSNCVVPSSFYAVCCLDECESLMSQVEHAVQAPLVEPSLLARTVEALASPTVEAPRNLSTLQLRRLDEIAAFHGGMVPLHGRLFAQWMHHNYPRECRFPHAVGTTNQLSQDEWMLMGGNDTDATDEEIEIHLSLKVDVTMTADEKMAALPWITSEELIGSHKARWIGCHQLIR